MNIFCKNCGTKLNPDAQFCKNCGKSVTKPDSPSIGAVTDNSVRPQSGTIIKCGNCGYEGNGEPARSMIGMVLAWLCVLFAPLITIIYFLATSKYRCPQCKSTFIGIKNIEGKFVGNKKSKPLVILLVVIVGIAVLGILS